MCSIDYIQKTCLYTFCVTPMTSIYKCERDCFTLNSIRSVFVVRECMKDKTKCLISVLLHVL